MIRLLTGRARIGLVVAAMAVAVPVVTFAQTTEHVIESVPAPDQPAVPNSSPTNNENSADNDTFAQTGPPGGLAISTTGEGEIQRRFNDLRREVLDDREKLVDWWLAATAIFLTLLGIVAVIAGYLSFKRFREIEAEARQNVTASQQYTEEARHLVEEIKTKRHEAESLMEGMNAQTVTDDPDDSGEANQAVKDVLRNPGASLIARAIANAISLQKRGKRDDAIEKWRAVAHVAEESDNDLAARAWFSVGYLRWDKNPEDCIFAYDQAIRLNPDYAAAYTNRGIEKHKLGRHEAALADHDEAIRLNPDYAAAYFNRGIAKHELGRHEAALADHDEAIRLYPDYAAAYFNRGIAKHELGRHEAALADHDEAIRLNPDYAAAYTNRGVAKHELGRHEAALADHDEAIRLNPGLAEAYTNRGIEKHELGRHEAALTDHDEAIRLNPGLAEAYFNRGNSKFELGRHEAALADYNEAIRLNPGLAEAYLNRGSTKSRLGRHEAALTDHDEAIRLNPDLAEAYFNRGVAKHELGLKDDARKDFEIGLELARKANDADLIGQVERALRNRAAGGS